MKLTKQQKGEEKKSLICSLEGETELTHVNGDIKGAEMKRMFLVFLFAALSLEKDRHLNHPFQKIANLTVLFLLGISRTLLLPNSAS